MLKINLVIKKTLESEKKQYLFAIFLLILETIYLCFRYSNSLGDFEQYITAGLYISDGRNPYEALMYTNSPVSAYLIFTLKSYIPIIFKPFIVQTVNVIGVSYFLKWYLGKKLTPKSIMVLNLLLLLNVNRALFGNVQVTGIVLGLIALAFNLVSANNKLRYYSIIPIWIAFEIKPQITIPFLIIYIYSNKSKIRKFTEIIGLLVSSHLILDYLLGVNLTFQWCEKIIKYSRNSLNQNSYEISVWKIFADIFGHENWIRFISLILILVFIIFLMKITKTKPDMAIFLALAFPLINTYVHLYDYVGLTLIAIKLITSDNKSSFYFLNPLFFIFPLSGTSLIIVVILQLFSAVYFTIYFKDYRFMFGGIFIVILQLFLYYNFELVNQELEMSLFVSINFLISIIFYVLRNKDSIK